jgi:hypothetical protein
VRNVGGMENLWNDATRENRITQRNSLYDFYINTDKYNGGYVSQSRLFF